ncbi:caspase family protein [Streptomyces sp. NPDC005648]|uniref:caspase family protein n=1 Tax=Streptomyces sp. NPDC005648 TaxID=3157044 RepID=UPI0033A8A707
MTEQGVSYRALLMGNADFPDEPGLRPLLGPANDLRALHDALTDPEVGLPWDVTVLAERTSQEVKEELDDFFQRATRRDQLLVYYSGHGLLDAQNRLHLCTRDTTVERLRTRAVRHSDITEPMNDCAAPAIIVVLDCCFSGWATAAKGTDAAALFAGRGRFVMTSCGRLETAADAPSPDRPSPFTAELVTGLRHGVTGGDGDFTVEDAYRYVDARLRGSGQRPEMKADGRVGQVALARRPKRPGPDAVRETGEPDTRPSFTDAHGETVRPRVETHFSGVLHVLLDKPEGTFSVYGPDLTGAAPGTPLEGWWFTPGLLRRRRRRLTGAATADGGVLFTLPDDAGTFSWPAGQLADLNASWAEGRWPSSPRPTQPDATHTVLAARDPVYAQGPGDIRAGLVCLALGAITGTVYLSFFRSGTHNLAGAAAVVGLLTVAGSCLWFLPAITSVAWNSSRLRRFVRLPPLPATPMLMRGRIDPGRLVVGNHGAARIPSSAEVIVWSEDFRLKLSAERYRQAIAGGAPPFGSAEPLAVKVIGLPAPGQWIAVQTPHGVLWPDGRAEACSPRELAEALGAPDPT